MYMQGTSDAPLSDMAPVAVAIIGTGDGSKKIVAKTAGEFQPDVLLKVISPLTALAVRFANSYLQTLVGLYSAAVVSSAIPASGILDLLGTCATLSLAGPVLGLMKDFLTIFGKLEGKYPLITGSV